MTIADLHCHYPMHLLARDPEVQRELPRRRNRRLPENLTLEYVIRVRQQPTWLAKLRALLVLIAARLKNFRRFEGTWRVDLDKLERGGVRIVCSVLYLPFAEIDDGPENDGDYDELITRLEEVETELLKHGDAGSRPIPVKSEGDLATAIKAERIAIVHCVEGGFHLGADIAQVEERVRELAARGVVYITLAHLIYRGVATNAPAFPMLSERQYDAIFCQPKKGGLSALGEAAVRAMYERRVLIDVSHMRQDALDDTFELLNELDEDNDKAEPHEYPVIASHAGYRFGDLSRNLSPETIVKIAERNGVIGLIMGQQQLNDGLDVGDPDDPETAMRVVARHVDAIYEASGDSHAHTAIGSDLDGFIKPTIAGIENVDDLVKVRRSLTEAYPDAAEAILWGNAERVLRKALANR